MYVLYSRRNRYDMCMCYVLQESLKFVLCVCWGGGGGGGIIDEAALTKGVHGCSKYHRKG